MVDLRPVGPVAQLGVRADEPAARALGLPLEPNTMTAGAECSILWLGPDEWLVIGEPPDLETDAGWVTTVDLSSNRVGIEISGPGARDLLAAGCSLDLHPRAFVPGRCAQTQLARAQVILEAHGADAFRVWVRPSFAPYLTAWLDDAAALLEHDGAVGVDEDAVLEVPADGP